MFDLEGSIYGWCAELRGIFNEMLLSLSNTIFDIQPKYDEKGIFLNIRHWNEW